MRRFTFTITIVFLLLGVNAFAQKEKIKKSKTVKIADAYYEREEYHEAAKYYRSAMVEDPSDAYAIYKLAESYRSYYDYLNAERWYTKLYKLDSSAFPLQRYWLAMMLKTNGKYEDADFHFTHFISEFKPKDAEEQSILNKAKFELAGCDFALEQIRLNANKYPIRHIDPPVNSKHAEYAPAICCGDTILAITTTRPGVKGGNETDRASGHYFSDIFRFQRKKDAHWTMYRSADGFDIINTERNDGTGQFNYSGNRFYYSSCAESENECAIYVVEKKGTKWLEPLRLNNNVNTPKYDTKQPSVSRNEDSIFFVSNRPGGLGQGDIWLSVKKNGDWAPAINLGQGINTPYQDISPYWDHNENALFFSSDGREGFGGLDIYMAYGAGLKEVINIGLPFNSNRDDFYFVFSNKVGYLTSNREGAIGGDDIFEVELDKKISLVKQLANNLEVEEKTLDIISRLDYSTENKPAPNAIAMLIDEDGSVLSTSKANADGVVVFEKLPRNKVYKVVLKDDNNLRIGDIKYMEDEQETIIPEMRDFQKINRQVSFNVRTSGGENNQSVEMVEDNLKLHLGAYESFTFLARLDFKGSKTEAVANVPVYLVDEDNNVLKYTNIGADGDIRFENLPSDKNYKIRVGDPNFVLPPGVELSIDDVRLKGSRRRSENSLFNTIYFDFDKSELKQESLTVLDALLKYYKQYPEIQIEMDATTDSKGSADYNKKLSEKRGSAALVYLMKNGVPRDAIVVNALGAAKAKTDVGEQDRALDRKIDFYVVESVGF